jgi:hypothetical protein
MSKNQLKQSTNGLYASKDKVMIDSSGYEVLIGSNSSFQEDSSYLKNIAGSNYQSNKNDASFDSSSNHGGNFSQSGTPMSYKIKLTNQQHHPGGGIKATANLKNLNLISTSAASGSAKTGKVASSIDRSKPKKLTLQNVQ